MVFNRTEHGLFVSPLSLHQVQLHSTTNLERPTASRLPLLGSAPLLRLGPRAAQHLQEIGGAPAHAAVDVGFAGLDVVVEVVAEGLDVRDDFFAAGWGEVAGEEDCEEGKCVC
jgi:hypothetical protein